METTEALWAHRLSSLAEGIIVQDVSGRVLRCNNSAERLLGLTVDQTGGAPGTIPGWSTIHEDGSPFPVEEHPAMVALRTGQSMTGVIMGVCRPDGTLRWVSLSSHPVLVNGKPTAVFTTLADVTEQKAAEHALRVEEKRWKTLVDSARDGIWEWNAQTDEIFFSRRWKEILGYEDSEIANSHSEWEDRIHPDDRLPIHAALNDHLDGKSPFYEAEYRLRCKDGTWKWVRARGTVVSRGNDGKPLRFVGAHTDITEQVRAQQALRESEERLRLAARAAEFGTYSYDFRTGSMFRSPEHLSLYGVPENGSLKYAEDLVPEAVLPEDKAGLLARIKASADPGGPGILDFEYRIVRADGQIRWLRARGRTIFQNGSALRCDGVVQDITERKRAEEALLLSEERFRQVSETVSDFVWEVDADGLYTYTGPSVEKILGYGPDEIVGKLHFYEFFPLDTREALKSAVLDGFAARQVFQAFLNSNVHKDGTTIQLETSGVPIVHPNGTLLGYRGASTDVSERYRAEAEARALREELALFSRVATVGELTASLAHELNQPLAAILSNTEAALTLMQSGTPDLREIRDILEDISADDQRAVEVIRSLRSLLKKGSGERSLLVLNDLITDVLSIVRSDAGARKISIVLDLASPLPHISGDRVQLQQMILNLIVNGFDAMERADGVRELKLRTRRLGKEIILDVTDSGSGLPPAKIDKIFDLFFTTKATGLGMGLPLSRSIATAHNGRLWAENNPERGATFHVALPVAELRPDGV